MMSGRIVTTFDDGKDFADYTGVSGGGGTSNKKKGKQNGKDMIRGHDIEEIFLKGTSKRIWRELYKVVDSSDVILQILD